MTEPLKPRDYLKLQIRLPKQAAFVLDDPNHGVLDRDSLGGEAEPNNLFVLDQSRLDDQLLSIPGEDPDTEWTDVLSFAQSVKIERGSHKTETGSELEVGRMNVTLIGPELDPHQNLAVVPGTPMRLVTVEDEPVFTGTIRRANTVYGDDNRVRVTLSIQDQVQVLANVKRYGADEGDFGLRVDDLLAKHDVAYERTGGSVELAQTDYEGNLISHLQLAVNSEDGWFYVDRAGVVQIGGAGTGYDPYLTATRTNLFKNPGLRAGTAYVSSYGNDWSYIDGGGREGRGAIGRTFTGSAVPEFTDYFTMNLEFASGSADSPMPVTPGKTMTFSAHLMTNRAEQPLCSWVEWWATTGELLKSAVSAPVFSGGQWARTSITLAVPANANQAVYHFGPPPQGTGGGVQWTAGDYLRASDIRVEESADLSEWFDGSSFDTPTDFYSWTAGENSSASTHVVATMKEGTLTFASNYMDDAYYYRDIDYTYDTGSILNELKVSNRQWGVNDQGVPEGITVDKVYADATSAATWGPSSATLETNLAEQSDIDDLAQKVLSRNRAPVNTVNSLTWNATKHMGVAATLEPYAVMRVLFENSYFEEVDFYRVLAIEHDISGDKWMTTLTLDHYERKF